MSTYDPHRPAPAFAPTMFDGLEDNPEVIARDRVLADLDRTRADLLAMLRERMRTLFWARYRVQGPEAFVTADDGRVVLESDPRVPGPDVLPRDFMGALFRKGDGWVSTGRRIKSATAGSHGNDLLAWKLAEAA